MPKPTSPRARTSPTSTGPRSGRPTRSSGSTAKASAAPTSSGPSRTPTRCCGFGPACSSQRTTNGRTATGATCPRRPWRCSPHRPRPSSRHDLPRPTHTWTSPPSPRLRHPTRNAAGDDCHHPAGRDPRPAHRSFPTASCGPSGLPYGPSGDPPSWQVRSTIRSTDDPSSPYRRGVGRARSLAPVRARPRTSGSQSGKGRERHLASVALERPHWRHPASAGQTPPSVL
jgi:hypothetical protein